MNTEKALFEARERGLDLIEIVPNSQPPVAKIMDYGKYLYQKAKEERKQKNKDKKSETKGVRISLKTGKHDLEFKAAQTDKFLKKGHRIKIEIVMKGREKAFQDLARQKLKEFVEIIPGKVKIEQEPKKNPMGLIVIVARAG